jgi:hypothetical protein
MKRSFLSLSVLFFLVAVAADVRAQAHFLRGDSNHDKNIDISDGISTLRFLFLGDDAPPCGDAADVNDDGNVDIADAIATFSFLFTGGSPPRPPYPVFEADSTADGLNCLGPAIEITGDITSNRTLTRNQVYRLVSAVTVRAGTTLTIEEGTTVLGDSATEGLLVVERGARLVAAGMPTHPVVFTSDKPVTQRGRGDWGGLIILGRGDNNVPGKQALAEGLDNQFWGGGQNVIPNDDSGRLSYVRVEYGGTEISMDNEVNAISLFGVGNMTQIDHVQVKYNLDDGIEWFGGNCSARFCIANGIGDDSFDYSFGWSGRGQFWVAQQRGDDADRGFEVDNSESEFGATPRTRPMLSNVTLVGDPTTDFGPESTQGLLLRRGCGGLVYNAIVTGFKTAGLDIDDGVTTNDQPGNLVLDHSVFFSNGPGPDFNRHFQTGETGANEESLANGFNFTSVAFGTTVNTNNILATMPPLVDAFNFASPNFRPQNDALMNPFNATSLDSFFQPAPYRGAVPPGGEDWTKEPWISYAQN